MSFSNQAGDHVDTDEVISRELEIAGIEVISQNCFRKEEADVKSRIKGTLHGWLFERAWTYWVATGPGLDVETAVQLHKEYGSAVRVNGDGTSPCPRECYKGLGSGFYHVDDQQGLIALADAIRQVVKATREATDAPYAEQDHIGEEIEKKFLVRSGWRAQVTYSAKIRQGYLNSNPMRTVRVRIQDDRAVLTIKGLSDASGERCPELNKRISLAEAAFMFDLCEPGVIDKTRHFVPVGNYVFEIDEFGGANAGLIVAEISFKAQGEDHPRPEWLGEEVTKRAEYKNSALAKKPYSTWSDAQKG